MTMVEHARRNLAHWWLALALVAIAGALMALPLTSAVLAIGGALALLAVLRWPELALYALIFAVPYGSWFPIPVSVGNLTAVDLLVVVVLALWFARLIAREHEIRIRWPPLSLPFAIFLFAALLTTTVAISLQYAAKELVKWFEMFAMYVYVANNLDAQKAARVLAVLLLAGASEAAIGIYQFLFRVGPEGFSLFGRFMRAYGTFEQPNPYAGYLGLIIPIALGVVLSVNTDELRPRKQSTVNTRTVHRSLFTRTQFVRVYCLLLTASVSLVAMLAALLMSWSRGAWLGVAAALVVVVVVQSRRAFVLSVIAAFVLTFAILLSSINLIPGVIAERFSGIGDYFGVFDVRGVKVDDANFAIVERMAHWQAAWEMWRDLPLLGVGFGNYVPAYPAYALPRWSDPLGHAHNYYLNIAAEAGLVGLLAYLGLWSAAAWQGWRALRVTRGMWHSVAAGLLGMIVALAIHNGFDNLFVHGMVAQVGISLGITSVISKSPITND
ncbi:MAG: O-antigen ligase family protein [Chloroflexi bacterium]|nr:O-antigen ligase family protein [Chloroflexota bacterium]